MRIRKIGLAALAVAVFAASAAAGGGGGVGIATEATQLLNNAELVDLMANAEQQLQHALTNLKSLDGLIGFEPTYTASLEAAMNQAIAASILDPDNSDLRDKVNEATTAFNKAKAIYDADLSAFNKGLSEFERINAIGTILDVKDAISKKSAIFNAIGQMDQNFRKLYPGTKTTVRTWVNGETFENLSDYTTYQNQQMIQSCEEVLRRYDLSVKDLDNNKKVLEILRDKSRNARGIKQAIQASSEIATQQAMTMGNLVEAVRANTALQAQIQAKQNDEAEVAKGNAQAFFKANGTVNHTGGSSDFLNFTEYGKKLHGNQGSSTTTTTTSNKAVSSQ